MEFDSDILYSKCNSLFLLHSLGDIIGFKNGDWQYNYSRESSLTTVMEFVFEFIKLGGINGIDISGFIASDDTIYHSYVAEAMKTWDFNVGFNSDFRLHFKNALWNAYDFLLNDSTKSIFRLPVKSATENIRKIDVDTDIGDNSDARFWPYDPESGDNNCATRSTSFGIIFNKEKKLDMFIDCVIEQGKLSHQSPIGYLGGLNSAYFVYLGMNNIDINMWPFLLIKLLESDSVKKHINFVDVNCKNDYNEFVEKWKEYIDTRFDNETPIKTRLFSNMVFRTKYYWDHFVKDTRFTSIGQSGYCVNIVAYDSLLDCDGFWEKIIFYAILNPGDKDSTGAIAGSFYASVYGFGDVPRKMIEQIEMKDELYAFGKEFYNKFCT